MTYRYVVGKCHWKPREQADAGHDLVLTDIAMFEHASEAVEHLWSGPGELEFDGIEITMNLNDLNKLEIGKVSGVIPGSVIERPYDLQSKCERVRNQIIGRALAQLLQQAQDVRVK